MANRSLNVPANLQPAACSAMSGERMQQLAERLLPVSASLVNSSRGIATSTIRRSDEDKAEKEAKLKAEREAKEKAEREAKLKAEKEAKLKAEKEAKEKAEKEAKEKAEREARLKAEQEAK